MNLDEFGLTASCYGYEPHAPLVKGYMFDCHPFQKGAISQKQITLICTRHDLVRSEVR